MAEVSLYTVSFHDNSPFPGFVTGDVVEIRIEITELAFGGSPSPFNTFTSGVRYYKNSVLTTSSTSFLQEDSAYNTSTNITATICLGTSKAKFTKLSVYPYANYYEIPNSNECSVNPEICDLIIVGQPDVVDASGQYITDGEIRITATSSNPIEYKLGSDFVYGDGTSQTSNEFLGLIPGTYDFYIIDSANCKKFIKITVGISLDYGVRFRHEYDDQDGNVCRVDVTRRDYSGDIEEVCGSDVNFLIELRGEGSQDKFEEVLSHNSVLGLISSSNFQYLELFTNDPERYRIQYYENDVLKSITKLVPNQGLEQYKAPPYYSNFIGQDGLPQLKEFLFIQDDGQVFFGKQKLIKLVSDILKKTKILLPIRVGINMYADGMLTTDSDDPFDQSYFDYKAFYLFEKEPTFLSVLRGILASFGAKIIQWDGHWNIIRTEEHVGNFDYRTFDSDGEYASNATMFPVIDLKYPKDSPDLIFIRADQQIEMQPGYGVMKVVHPLGYTANILINGDFRLKLDFISYLNKYVPKVNTEGFTLVNAGYALSEEFEQLTDSNVAYIITAGSDILSNTEGGNAYIKSDSYILRMGSNNQIKIGIKCKVVRSSVQFGETTYTIDAPYIPVRLEVKYGPFYLDDSGYWSFAPNEVRFYIDEFNTYKEFDLLSQVPKWREYQVDLATTTNIVLSGEQVIDGVMTSASRVLVKNQSDPTENGIRLSGPGTWTTPIDVDLSYENAVAFVDSGVSNGGDTIIQVTRSVGTGDAFVWVPYNNDINLSSVGMPFSVRTYHAYAFHADFLSIESLRAERTKSIGALPVILTGEKRTVRYDDSFDEMWFYELREGTDADTAGTILRPDDYNGTTNARVWVRTNRSEIGGIDGVNYFPFYIDYVSAQFLTNGKEPIDTVIRIENGETNNNRVLEKRLTLGSYSELLTTFVSYGLDIGFKVGSFALGNAAFSFSTTTMNVLPADLIYTAYLRDEDGIGYEFWTRDGIAELDKLHGIILNGMSAQYNKPWRLMRGSIKTMAGNKFGLLNVFREVNDNNRIYVPIGISLNTKTNIVSGEYLETINIYENPGSDGSGQAPYTSGFTTGFGASGFN